MLSLVSGFPAFSVRAKLLWETEGRHGGERWQGGRWQHIRQLLRWGGNTAHGLVRGRTLCQKKVFLCLNHNCNTRDFLFFWGFGIFFFFFWKRPACGYRPEPDPRRDATEALCSASGRWGVLEWDSSHQITESGPRVLWQAAQCDILRIS